MYIKGYKGRQDEMRVVISLEIQSKETLVHFIICTKNHGNFASKKDPDNHLSHFYKTTKA